MNIETKYDVEDRCWIMFSNRPTEVEVNCISVFIDKMGIENAVNRVEYSVGPINASIKCSEDKLFTTKEELIKSL